MSILTLDGIMLKSFSNLAAMTTYGSPPAAVPYGFEGIAFTPPDTGPWMYATVLPVSSDQRLQTADKYIRMLQVDCNDEMNIGTGRLKAVVDEVLAYYWPRRLFSNTLASQKFRVKKSDDSTVRIYGGYQSVSVTVTFDGSVDRAFS